MKVFILHYHLNPGGVTRIIESQIAGIKSVCSDVEVQVVAGACDNPDDFSSVPLHINPDLNYLPDKVDKDTAKSLYTALYNYLDTLWTKQDVIHFHNLNLAKNPVLTLVVHAFINKGYKVFNHAHDFAEDRPANMQFMKGVVTAYFNHDVQEVMYPTHTNVLYGVLNGVDYTRLREMGIEADRLSLLPNPLPAIEDIPPRDAARRIVCSSLAIDTNKLIVTYPVRVIQRKNIGEFVLLAQLFQDKASFVVTLPPKNPKELVLYNQWKAFCEQHQVPVVFEAGLHCAFDELLVASDFCLTTSRMEGFGMAYMEPWLFNTPVVGRNLSSVTTDLIQSGMQFSVLYDAILVMQNGAQVDFSQLSEDEQRSCIVAVINQGEANPIVKENPFLQSLFLGVKKELIENNKEVINKEYAIDQYGKKLLAIYQKLTG